MKAHCIESIYANTIYEMQSLLLKEEQAETITLYNYYFEISLYHTIIQCHGDILILQRLYFYVYVFTWLLTKPESKDKKATCKVQLKKYQISKFTKHLNSGQHDVVVVDDDDELECLGTSNALTAIKLLSIREIVGQNGGPPTPSPL